MAKKFILSSAMTSKEITAMTGLSISYKEKRKTGVSIKFREAYNVSERYALELVEKYTKMFPNAIVRKTNGSSYYSLVSVRVMIPYSG